jgi:hypothetical protein
MRTAPPVAFLGFCERATHLRDGYVNLAKWNLLGLKSVVVAPMYPLGLRGSAWVFGIFAPSANENIELVIRSAEGVQIGAFRHLSEVFSVGL